MVEGLTMTDTPPLDQLADDEDELDACDIDFNEHLSPEEEVGLLPLFPDGVDDPEKAKQWKELFGEVHESS